MKHKVFITVLILTLISLIPLIDFFRPNFPLTHDGQDHIARIANFYQNLQEGNIFPRWAANLNWGYGHPILMFLYPAPSYIASFFHFLGFSFIDSIKIVFGLAFIFSGITMYLFAGEMLNRKAGFLAAVLYMFAPYRFIDLYVRGAIGEHVAFIFPPLILYFLLKLSKKYNNLYIIGGSFSFAGLILSHNAITLMFLPLIFLFILYLGWQISFKKYFILNILFIIIIGFGLASFFWIPAFFEGKYTLRDIVTKGTYVSSFVDLKQFLYGEWNYGGTGQFSVQVGILHWVFIIFSIPTTLYLIRKKSKLWYISFLLFIIFFVNLFLMTSYSNFIWQKLTIIQKFQFPWRLLSVIVFISSVLGGIVLYVIPKRLQVLLNIVLIILILFFSRDYWHAKGYLKNPESFYTGVYNGTTDTGESAPIWSVRFMEKRPKDYLEVIEGKASIKKIIRKTNLHTYELIVNSKSRLRENTLYFPGWKVFVDGKETEIEFQDQANRGLITFFVPKGKYLLEIKFQETKLRTISNIFSVLSIGFIIIYGILGKRLWQHYQ